MRKIRLDLFKLYEENDKGTGRIKVVPNYKFLTRLRKIRRDLEKKGMSGNEIAKKLKVHPDLFYRYFNGTRKVPLVFIKNLLDLWSYKTAKKEKELQRKKVEICEAIKYLDYGAGKFYRKVKASKFLNESLCFISGSIAADGSIDMPPKVKKNYVIRLYDRYKENIIKFCELIKQEFELKINVFFSKKDNCWYIKFANKIVFRYLTNIFEFIPGKKAATVKMPSIIKSNGITYKIAFLKGFVTFEGGIGFGIPKISIPTKSKKLFKDLLEIFEEMKVKPDYINNKILDPKDVYTITFWDKKKLKKLLGIIFEKNSIKWNQLNCLLNKFSIKDFEKINEVIAFLEKIYPKAKKNAITYSELLKIIKKTKFITLEDAEIIFNKHPRTIHTFIKNLEKWKILNSKRSGIYKVWYINPNLTQTKEVN